MNSPDQQAAAIADVVVVGGGPAGSTAARKLSLAGFSTIVMDTKMEIGAPVVCADMVNLGFKDLHELREDPRITLGNPERIELRAGNASLNFFPSLDEGDAFNTIVERDRLDKELMSMAVMSGARFRIRTEFISSVEDGGQSKVTCRAGGKLSTVSAGHVIMATGMPNAPPPLNRGGQKEFTFSYRRSIEENGLPPSIDVGGSCSLTYRVPRGNSQVNGVVMAESGVEVGGEQVPGARGNEIISGSRKLIIMDVPYSGKGLTLQAGSAANLFDGFFLSGFREAYLSGAMAAQAIKAHRDDGRDALSAYRQGLETSLSPDMKEQVEFRSAFARAPATKLKELFSDLSQYEFHEVSVREILKRSGYSTDEISERLSH